MRLRYAVACGAAFVPAASALAHHGDAGRYEQTITTLAGTVVTLQLINPHSRIVFEVVDAQTGASVTWQAEISNPNGLARIGWNKATLEPGDPIILSGRVLKSGAPYINLTERARLVKADTCEEIYRSDMISGRPPDYPPPDCG